jgi:outer membrane immunogenic protein
VGPANILAAFGAGDIILNKLLLASAALTAWAGISPAMATDMPLKAPARVAPAWDWSGFYLGGAVGAKSADTTWTTTSTIDPPFTFSDVDASSPRDFRPFGPRVGVYGGFNRQNRAWVYGVEFDVAYANKTASSVGIPGCTIQCTIGSPGPGVDTSSVRMGSDASLRARVGYLATPGLLLYATGGVAWQQIETSGFCQHSFADPQCQFAPPTPFDLETDSRILTGWTLGGGIESRIFGNWLFRGEYRYADFGTFTGAFPFSFPGFPPGVDTLRYNLSVITHTATLGLAYKLDWGGW